MANIVELKDSTSTKCYPITKAQAVYFDDGSTIIDLKNEFSPVYKAEMNQLDVMKRFTCKTGDKVHIYSKNGQAMTPSSIQFWTSTRVLSTYANLSGKYERSFVLGDMADVEYISITGGTAQDVLIINESCYFDVIPQYVEKNIALNSKNVYIDIGEPIMERCLLSNGYPDNGTANQWITDYIRVPTGKTFHVCSLYDQYTVAGYNEERICSGFYIGTGSTYHIADVDTYFTTGETDVYLRIGFYNANGRSSELHEKSFKLYYYEDDQKIEYNDNHIEKRCEWAFCSIGNGIEKSNNTIGMHTLIKAEKPLHIEVGPDYKGAYVVYSTNDSTQTAAISQWFSNDLKEFLVPEGFYIWVGLRLSDDTAQEYLIEDISSVIKMNYVTDNEVIGYSIYKVSNGYVMGGAKVGSRICTNGYRFTNVPLLVHRNQANAVYTLAYCTNGTDLTNDNWSYYASYTNDMIIPAGSYYIITYGSERDDVLFIDVNNLGMDKFAAALLNNIGTLSERIMKLEQDKQENIIPDYYREYILDKADDIKHLSGEQVVQFAFITDTHINNYNNARHSKSLLTYLCKHTDIQMVVDGGDMWNSSTDMEYVECINQIRSGADYTTPDYPKSRYMVIGNHDTGTEYIDGVKHQGIVSVEDFAKYSSLYINKPGMIQDPNSPTQYYFDDDVKKVRFIVLNFELRDESTGEGYGDSCIFYANAISTAPDGYSIILFTHLLWNGGVISDFMRLIMDSIDAYNSRGTISISGISFNFSSAVARIVCMIVGHMHKDMDTATDDGIPCIAVTTDNAGAEQGGLDRTIGTVNEQAFDVFTVDLIRRKLFATRIGAGSDREFSIPSFN